MTARHARVLAGGRELPVRHRPPDHASGRRAARPEAAGEADRGSAVLWLAIVMVAMMAFAALVLDGGAAVAARGQAADVAQQAARAGADALSPATLRGAAGAGALVATAPAARSAAGAVLQAAGITDYVVTVTGNTVTVSARAVRSTLILSAFGVDQVSGRGAATAVALLGTTGG